MHFSVHTEAGRSCVTQEGILDVLRFSDKWEALGVQAFCLQYLAHEISMKTLHPILALAIGRRFGKRAWLKDALVGIQRVPVATWISNEAILSWMTPDDMIMVIRLRDYAHSCRLDLISLYPQAVHSSSCHRNEKCAFLWELAWTMSIIPRITHSSFSSANIYCYFNTDLKVEGMGEGCLEMSKNKAIESGRFWADSRGADKALELI